MAKTKTIRKPGPLRTPSIGAKCHIDRRSSDRGRVVVSIFDRAPWTDLGVAPPTDDELEKLTRWIRKVRSFRNNRNRKA